MNKLVTSTDQIVSNIHKLFRYGEGSLVQRKFHNRRIKNGKLFAVIRSGDQVLFAPSKFAGYVENDLSYVQTAGQRDGRLTNRKLDELLGRPLEPGDAGYADLDRAFIAYCDRFGVEPSKHHRARRYWVLPDEGASTSFVLPEEIIEPSRFYEGASQRVFVNRYERSLAARRRCIARFGHRCSVCEMSFEERYGQLGKDFIHVHHLIPLSQIAAGYEVDGETDLRPVCPNCHAMLHRNELRSIEELRSLYRGPRRPF